MSSSTASGVTSWAALFRLSLRELLVLIAVTALAIVSLRYASAWWEALMFVVTLMLFVAMVIVALVGSGAVQAFAIGMTVAMSAYIVAWYHRPPDDPRHLGMLTNHLLVRLQTMIHSATRDVRYVDSNGREIVDFDPSRRGFGQPGAPRQGVYTQRLPQLRYFLPIGHCWWVLLLGYIGGRFARVVYLRRSDLPREPR
jgi:hypothetical protein